MIQDDHSHAIHLIDKEIADNERWYRLAVERRDKCISELTAAQNQINGYADRIEQLSRSRALIQDAEGL